MLDGIQPHPILWRFRSHLYTPEMTSISGLSFNRLNSCGLLLMLACFPSAGCSCQVTLKCSCLCPFHELDTHQIICIWLRMDLGCEYVYKKSLTLDLALSPVHVKLYTVFSHWEECMRVRFLELVQLYGRFEDHKKLCSKILLTPNIWTAYCRSKYQN